MKNKILVLVLPLLLAVFAGCNKNNNESDEINSSGFISLSFDVKTNLGELKSTKSADSDPRYLQLTIKNSSGELVYNAHKLELIKLGDGFITGNIQLYAGNYSIEDFLVLNSNNETIYLTPKINSELAFLVTNPLPMNFSVSNAKTSQVNLEVIPSDIGEPEDFGYATFSFDIVKLLVLQPDAEHGTDAFIENWPEQNYSNRNFGTHREFQTSAWTAGGIPLVVRGLIKFDLTSIPEGSEIRNARLYLYSVANTVNGPGHSPLTGSNEFILQKVTSSWDEMEVTWNTQPTTTGIGQILLPASDSCLQDYVIDITEFVQDMVDDPANNFGLMMKLNTEEHYRKILFASSDYGDDSLKHPKLVVYYK